MTKMPTVKMRIDNIFNDNAFEIVDTNLSVFSLLNKPIFDRGYPKEINITVKMDNSEFTTTAYYHGMVDECYMDKGKIIHTNKTHYNAYYFYDMENILHYFKPVFYCT